MQIWVDADACPKVIKDILFRAAERRRIPLILVANQPQSCRRYREEMFLSPGAFPGRLYRAMLSSAFR